MRLNVPSLALWFACASCHTAGADEHRRSGGASPGRRPLRGAIVFGTTESRVADPGAYAKRDGECKMLALQMEARAKSLTEPRVPRVRTSAP